MADDTSTTEAPEVETPEPTEAPKPHAVEVPPEVKRALAKANKEAETLRLKLQEFEDRDKTEAERLSERVSASESRAAEAETRATRLEVILAKLPDDATADDVKRLVALSKRLVGSTRDELEADADELLSTFKTGGTPRPADIGQGARQPAPIADPKARDLAQIEQDLKAASRR
jgi:hypothetical protein